MSKTIYRQQPIFLSFLFVVLGLLLNLNAYAQAPTYPVKPIKLIAPVAAGGGLDNIARSVAEKLSRSIGQPVVVENMGGGGGAIASQATAKAPADGYTLLVMSSGDAIVQALLAKTPRDLELGFAPVSMAATGAYVLVIHPSVPARSVRELIALGKARGNTGKLT